LPAKQAKYAKGKPVAATGIRRFHEVDLARSFCFLQLEFDRTTKVEISRCRGPLAPHFAVGFIRVAGVPQKKMQNSPHFC
jgi:hypothetical protein